MNKKSVFVFDTTRGFSRFIKLRYIDFFYFDICNNPVRFKECFKKQYDISFVIINTYEDLLNFTYIYENSRYVFVGSAYENINEMLPKFKKVILLDLKKMKSDIIKQIDINLDIIKLDIDESSIL